MEHEFSYTSEEINDKLSSIINETLGDIDVNNAFDKTIGRPKVTGIAGDVIEQSVLGYPANSDQKPDIIVDGKNVEVKTTGVKYSTKSLKKKKQTVADFEAKEPMSVTAVSPEKIANETFDDSNFWHKLENILFFYYHYDSPTTVKSWEYKDFKVVGAEFHEFSNADKERLKQDWEKVRDFIIDAQKNYPDPTTRYPLLGSLRKELLLIDTAPKYPNPPRFRLKRSTVTSIIQEYFGKKFEKLPQIDSFSDIDKVLHNATQNYRGLTVKELLDRLDIKYKLNSGGDVNKNIAEKIILKLFGSNASKLNKIDIFQKANLTLKSIVQTKKQTRTEDTKLFPIDFDEIELDPDFEESQFYTYFSEKQFIFAIFEEPDSESKLLKNKFLGFKRVSFDDHFIDNYVHKAWEHTRNLVLNDNLVEETVISKQTGRPIINKNGTPKTKLNFIKGSENPIFVRGSGKDSKHKPLRVNGIDMYAQWIWIKGSIINEILNSLDYI